MSRRSLVFFLSGVAALVYETVWARLLTRTLGSQAGATAVVLAIFMAGLGLGAWGLASVARRARRPERLFAGLEVFIAAWACLVPWLLGAVESLGGPVGGLGARALVAGLVLLPPTIAMGATFPTMGRLTIETASEAGRATSSFYAANTFGATLGALLGTAAAMPLLGLRGAGLAAAGVGLCAAALATTLRSAERTHATSPPREAHFVALDPFLVVPALFGLASLALEVVLARLLVTVTGASIHAFAIVLAVFLLGIGLGSAQAQSLLADPARARRALFTCALAAPLLSLVGALALRWQLGEPDLFASLGNRMPPRVDPLRMWASHAVFAGLALLPPTVAFGCALPACVAVAVDRARAATVETTLGRVYASNTLGAMLGSLGAGFFLLPELGLRGGYAVALAPCALAALLVPGRRLATALGGIAVTGGIAFALLQPAERQQVLLHIAGRYEMVAVEETLESDGRRVRSIRLNGKVEASTAPVDVRLQRLLGHVPGLLHGDVENALVIGTGTGMTAGSLLDLPELRRLTLFEIEPRVLEGTRLFGEWNNGLVDDPRLVKRFGDGRHSLFRSEERFDLITADPLHVWSRGSSDLYTLEYFREMARHLEPGGVASQWIGLYELSTRDVQTVLATWCGAFAHTQAYLTAYDLALIGSNDPIERDLSQVELPPAVARRLAEVGVHSGAEIAALCVADDASLRAFVAGVPPMVDDLPILEFRAPLSFLRGYSEEVLRWCARDEFVETLPAASRERAREVRRLLRQFLDALPSGMSAAAARYGRELLALPPLGSPEAGR